MKTTPWLFASLFCAAISWTSLLMAQANVQPDHSDSGIENASSESVVAAVPAAMPAPVAVPTASVPCNECAQGAAMVGYAQGPRRGPLVESYSKYYNCKYHGSYNHPVPPQFTYFWPGLYKQKSIADYQSVYRNTMLISPSEVFNPNAVITVPAGINGQTIIEK